MTIKQNVFCINIIAVHFKAEKLITKFDYSDNKYTFLCRRIETDGIIINNLLVYSDKKYIFLCRRIETDGIIINNLLVLNFNSNTILIFYVN